MTFHVCSVPIWEKEVYWEVGAEIENEGYMDTKKIPQELQKYPHEDVVKSLKQLAFDGKVKKTCNNIYIFKDF